MKLNNRQLFYLGMAIIAAITTETLLAQYVLAHGLSLQPMFSEIFANNTTQFMFVEILVLLVVYLVWMLHEAKKLNMKNSWVYVLLAFMPSPAVSLPVFLLMRDRKLLQIDETRSTQTGYA